MSSILDLEVFVRTADTGSLSAAARGLGLTPAAASIALKRLETRLDIRLLARSTRSMRLTEEGKRYLDSVRVALAALSEGEQALKQQGQGLTGLLQLAAPSDFGRNVVLGWLDEFKQEHPNIRLQLLLNDSNADLFRDTVDIALRFGVPRIRAWWLCRWCRATSALPVPAPTTSFAMAPPPRRAQLAQHNTLRYMRQGRANSTWFFRQGSDLQEVEVTGDYLSDDGEIVRRWALAGHGIAYKAHLDIARDLKAGRLVQLLPDWQGEPTPFNLMCPHRLQVSERVKMLHRFLQVRCQALLNP
ncbi:LysR family transcriptional regulator [Pseudomonas lactucae]|uniref:LysR family transcriptional regulator n=1 Tax=Pseudomonas lactucae TaxID=2813360 RepID=UPI001CECB2E0|nr:LysR family transcriptional regulator [Pseudomonas lactucae]